MALTVDTEVCPPVEAEPPERARDVLEARILLADKFRASSDGPLRAAHIAPRVAEWLSRFVERIDGDTYATAKEIDSRLSVDKMMQLVSDVVDMVSMSDLFLRGFKRYWLVQFRGGCDCPECRGGKNDPRMKCSYKYFEDGERIPPEVPHAASNFAPLVDSDPLDAPWWCYQMTMAYQQAHGQYLTEAKKEEKKVEKAHEILGVN